MSPTPTRTRSPRRGNWWLVWAGAFALCEWLHLVLDKTTHFESFEWLDGLLHGVGPPLKILTLVSIPRMLFRVLARCHKSARTAGLVGVGWLLSGLLLLGGLSAAREPLGRWLSNAQDKFYPVTRSTLDAYSAQGYSMWGDGVVLFLARWERGEIITQEALLLVTAILGLVAIGYFLGHLARTCSVLATVWLVFILCVGRFALGMIDFEADSFIAGTLMGSLFYDVAIPFAPLSAVSPITSLAYLLLMGTPLLVLRFANPEASEGLDPGSKASPAMGDAGQGR